MGIQQMLLGAGAKDDPWYSNDLYDPITYIGKDSSTSHSSGGDTIVRDTVDLREAGSCDRGLGGGIILNHICGTNGGYSSIYAHYWGWAFYTVIINLKDQLYSGSSGNWNKTSGYHVHKFGAANTKDSWDGIASGANDIPNVDSNGNYTYRMKGGSTNGGWFTFWQSGYGKLYEQIAFKCAEKFFTVIEYEGNGTSNGSGIYSGLRYIDHDLGSTPAMIWVGDYTNGSYADTWHKYARDSNQNNCPAAGVYGASLSPQTDGYRSASSTFWHMTPTQFGIRGDLNSSGRRYVAYIWADGEAAFGDSGNEKVIDVGQFDGDQHQTQGNLIKDFGFHADVVFLKTFNTHNNFNAAQKTWMFLTECGLSQRQRTWTQGHSVGSYQLDAKAWSNSKYGIGFDSTGMVRMKQSSSDPLCRDHAHAEYVYIAFRKHGMGPPKHKEAVFLSKLNQLNGQGSIMPGPGGGGYWAVYAGYPSGDWWQPHFSSGTRMKCPDMYIIRNVSGSGECTLLSKYAYNTDQISPTWNSHLGLSFRNDGFIGPSDSDLRGNQKNFAYGSDEHENGWHGAVASAGGRVSSCWKNAKGFYDNAVYIGDGSNTRNVRHSLGTVPEMIWVKCTQNSISPSTTYGQNTSNYWTVWTSLYGNGNAKFGTFGNNAGFYSTSNTRPSDSASHFGVLNNNSYSSNYSFNEDEKLYTAHLFGSVTGISKIGTYTGTGNAINVDCGFTNGVRWLMIKRLDSTGDWYYWDVNSPVGGSYHSKFDSSTNRGSGNYVSTLNAGFTVDAGVTSHLNANGGTYLYYALA